MFRLPDPGWLFLLAGAALLAATVLLSASDDLARSRLARDRAIVLRDLHAERLARHEAYLRALEASDPIVLEQLAATQLGAVPAGQIPLSSAIPVAMPASQSASVFAELEPPPRPAPTRSATGSTLERWATGDQSRIWLIAAGGLLLLIGVLPASRPRRSGG